MVTKQQHEDFLSSIDDYLIEFRETIKCLDDRDSTIELCINKFTQIRYGKELPIVWVKDSSTEVKEFYPPELNLTWMITYITYFNQYLIDDPDEDLESIKHACIFLAIALGKIKGINILDNIVYVLPRDIEFVDYKLDRLIGFSPTT